MTGSNRKQIALLLFCIVLSTLWSYEIRRDYQGIVKMPDFAEIYYGARCAILHQDPYDPNAVARTYKADNPGHQSDPLAAEPARLVVTVGVNLPTTLFAAVHLALLPWSVAQNLWMLLCAALLFLAAYLMCDLMPGAPIVSSCLAAFMLITCLEVLILGNLAGAAVGLCVIAAWCFLKDRFAPAGVALLAISLVLKPHDAGFVWLYFLLAGGNLRKRAWQTLGVAAALGLCTAVWIARISPHWYPELHRNIASETARGGIDDPGPTGAHQDTPAPVIDLQAAVSIFHDEAGFYNLFSYAIVGALILLWIATVLRKRGSWPGAVFALAPIAALTMLPVYHRPYDAKLLLLALPACAMLWAAKAPKRGIVLALTAAAVVATSDIPLAIDVAIGQSLSLSADTLGGKIATLLLLRPAPLVLLALGCSYLWVYMRYDPPAVHPSPEPSPTRITAAAG